jgi:hypothetical protein
LLALVLRIYALEDRELAGLIRWEHVAPESRLYIAEKVRGWAEIPKGRSLDQAFSLLSGELKSTKGFGYPTKGGAYQSHWTAAKARIPGYCQEYQGVQLSREKGGAGYVLTKLADLLIELA